MLAHRLRRWSSIEPTLAECLVFAGINSGQSAKGRLHADGSQMIGDDTHQT